MRVVVVGDGKVGHTLTEQLSREGHDVVVIDSNRKAIDDSTSMLDVMGIQGNGASYMVQVEAGVPKADLLIAATSADEINILCCLIAKKLGAKHTIARVRNPEYAEQLVFMQEDLGLSMSINPERAAASEIFRMLRFPTAAKIESFSRGRVELVELTLSPDSVLDGMPLVELYQKYQVKVLICAVRRGDEVCIPDGDFTLHAGDKMSVTAPVGEVERFFRILGVLRPQVRDVILVGGGRIAYYLARRLIEAGIGVKIIEQNSERCEMLCELIPRAAIIQGDGTDAELLCEEGIDHVGAMVSLTGFDEENIILSMYAATRGVGKIITKVSRTALIGMISGAGLDSIISPKDITASRILTYVRAMQNSLGSNVETLHKIVGGRAEALEFHVRDEFQFRKIPLKELALKPNLLIACITRGMKVIIPGGDDCIETDDRVVVVTTSGGLRDLSDILQDKGARTPAGGSE
ncbi:MAG: Trk system potassium transporter TrkA [Oscillospiraceae bacterium]